MNKNELQEMLEQHQLWLNNNSGERINLQGADLSGIDLRKANLRGANLQGVRLRVRPGEQQQCRLRGPSR